MMDRELKTVRRLLAGAILCILLLSGCQPTDKVADIAPELPNGREGSPEQITGETEVPLWDESMAGDRLTLPEDLSDYSWYDPTSFSPREIIGVVDMAVLFESHNLQKKLDNLMEQVNNYQQIWYNRQDDLGYMEEEAQKHYANVEEQIQVQMQHIYEGYQEKIEEYVEKLQKELLAVEEDTWKEASVAIQKYTEKLHKETEKAIEDFYEEITVRYGQYKDKVRQKYAHRIFNLRLQLELAFLTEDEQKRLVEELEELLATEERLLRAKEEELQEELQDFVDKKEAEYVEAGQRYQDEKQEEAEKKLRAKQQELDRKMVEYIGLAEKEMERVMEERQKVLADQAEEMFQIREKEIEKDLADQWDSLQSKLENAYKEIELTEEQILDEIKAIVAEIAREKQIDLVLTDVRVNVSGIDITEAVLAKIK